MLGLICTPTNTILFTYNWKIKLDMYSAQWFEFFWEIFCCKVCWFNVHYLYYIKQGLFRGFFFRMSTIWHFCQVISNRTFFHGLWATVVGLFLGGWLRRDSSFVWKSDSLYLHFRRVQVQSLTDNPNKRRSAKKANKQKNQCDQLAVCFNFRRCFFCGNFSSNQPTSGLVEGYPA